MNAIPRTIGLTLPQRAHFMGAMSLSELVDTGSYADESGLFSSLWIGDSLMAKPRPEAIAILGALAGVTKNVQLAVGCMASMPVRDPILLAYQWASLDQLSNGRMLLAACTGLVKAEGASEKEGAPYGVTDKSRVGRMEEYMEVLRLLWSQENCSFDGHYINFKDITILPRPIQSPTPIYLAANPSPDLSPERPQRRVARMADGWMTVQIQPNMFQNNWAGISKYLREEGRDPETFPTVAYHNVNIQADRDDALDESFRFLEAYYGPVFSPDAVRSWTAAGTPEQVVDDLCALYEEGAKEITLRITSWNWRQQLETLMHEVIPMLRSRNALTADG